MSKSYARVKSQGLKQNSNTNTNNNNGNKKMKNYKSYNKKSSPRKHYNNSTNSSGNSSKIQKKKEQYEVPVLRKMVHFNEIVEVGYTHPAEEYDRTSIVASKLTSEDIVEILHLREQFRLETIEATKKRAMEESQQSSPIMGNLMPSSPNMNFAIYASTSQGNSSLLTEVPSITTSIISSPVLTPRSNEDELISQQQKEIEYMIYQRQQMENNYLEALHYQQALQLLNQQQQQQNLWRLYSQQQAFIESDLYLQQANPSYYSNALSNNISPSMSLWFAQDSTMIPSEYDYQLMAQMEVM